MIKLSADEEICWPRASFCEDKGDRIMEGVGYFNLVYDKGVLCYNVIIDEVEKRGDKQRWADL